MNSRFSAVGFRAVLLLFFVSLLFAQGSAGAVQNITQLKITSITTPIKAGERLAFSYSAGNMVGEPCSAQIEYWFDMDGQRAMQGNDTLYLGTGETKLEEISLIMPSGLEGVRNFYMQMQCNDSVVVASRIIEITQGMPAMPLVTGLDIGEASEEEALAFSYSLESNQAEPVPVYVEEKILQDSNVLWVSSQSIPLSGAKSFKRYGPLLQPGNYQLVVSVSHGSEVAEMTREFAVKGIAAAPVSAPVLWLPFVALAFLLGLSFVGLWRLWPGTKLFRERLPFPSEPAVPIGQPASLPDVVEKVCPIESESKGVLEDESQQLLFEEAGLSSEEKAVALEFAGKTPVMQNIKGCIVTDKQSNIRCETTVSITVSNNSNRNWKNVLLLAAIPDFVAENVSLIKTDAETFKTKSDSVVKFSIAKIGAMQSATVVYTVPRLVSQAEANSVPLPAVIRYDEGQSLSIPRLTIEVPAAEAVEKEEAVSVENKSIAKEVTLAVLKTGKSKRKRKIPAKKRGKRRKKGIRKPRKNPKQFF